MTALITLFATFCAAYLGVRMADSPIGLWGELRVLASIPFFLWDMMRGRTCTDADIAFARAELEALYSLSRTR